MEGETLWLNLGQMAELFGVNKSAISKHLTNIYKSGELDREATVSKMETVQEEGGRKVRRQIDYYNLDAVISVGYRVNSSLATRFRIWATGVLKQHLTQGWTLNRQRLERNARELETALRLVRKTAQHPELSLAAGRGLIEIISRYTQTFLLLQQYDEGLLSDPKGQRGGNLPGVDEARKNIASLKVDLIKRQEATDLFAQEREEGLAAILGNLEQTVFGEPAYPSVEAKAAHLLYFVIKNHPFADGNKRTAAFLFVDFLHRNQRLLDESGQPVINDMGLAALTLLIAESDPKEKETMIRLIMNMLAREES
ncbi:MAG: virulence protein RhuM/Fic/DOC family protein [Desulfobulbaceae bacterium]|uniref:Virulence protein RhuM/Fic/DOC family protein n=1 Tax=Candidatus Desulfatifera sulfidica TaxID=2841691 RepID=A0A8J6T9J4_9BACT|nr:virulence protein RhuM/Fic/DOC family protein [Candidatus Desulfatifera sulfidica]